MPCASEEIREISLVSSGWDQDNGIYFNIPPRMVTHGPLKVSLCPLASGRDYHILRLRDSTKEITDRLI